MVSRQRVFRMAFALLCSSCTAPFEQDRGTESAIADSVAAANDTGSLRYELHEDHTEFDLVAAGDLSERLDTAADSATDDVADLDRDIECCTEAKDSSTTDLSVEVGEDSVGPSPPSCASLPEPSPAVCPASPEQPPCDYTLNRFLLSPYAILFQFEQLNIAESHPTFPTGVDCTPDAALLLLRFYWDNCWAATSCLPGGSGPCGGHCHDYKSIAYLIDAKTGITRAVSVEEYSTWNQLAPPELRHVQGGYDNERGVDFPELGLQYRSVELWQSPPETSLDGTIPNLLGLFDLDTGTLIRDVPLPLPPP